MNKVTYLFGAGASANSLPIVNQIPQRISDLIDILESNQFRLEDNTYFSDLNTLIPKTKTSTSIRLN